MKVACPHCSRDVNIRDAKPGKYQPACPKCGQKFLLLVPAEPGAAPKAKPLESSGGKAKPSETDQTIGLPQELTATAVGSAAQGADEAEETGQWTSQPTQTPDATLAHATSAPSPGASSASATRGNIDATVAPEQTTADRPSAATRASSGASMPGVPLPEGAPSTLGGYRIVKELGRGAMGAVYLARQMSLDRNVALKVIQSRWAKNPAFVARFTREAYAAAQLTHHNIVQIYDLGADGDTQFFSMEFVEGQSLGDILKRDGKLGADAAIGYVLQAARGLKFAHDHGLVHRDIKPDNLLLNTEGIVKVADLGLMKGVSEADIKTSGDGESLAKLSANVTDAGVAMGTPAYMSPEQAEDAANVDHRADIYSLGCTLYVLLTGRPPFEGATALEVITKHKTEPIVRPEALVKQVPQNLSAINMKMVAKNPGDRYGDLSEAIADMEKALGLEAQGKFSPKDADLETLETAATEFNRSSAAKFRGKIGLGFLAACLLTFVVGLFMQSFHVALAGVCLGVMTPLCYFALSGIKDRTYLFGKARELLYHSTWGDCLTWVVGVLVFLALLFVLGGLWTWLGVSVLAFALAYLFHAMIDKRAAREQAAGKERIEKLLKSQRLKGVDDASLQQFVARFTPPRWEEFFEKLFGYEAMLAARAKFGKDDAGKPREKFRPWRDSIVHWFDARMEAKKQAKQKNHLQKVEEASLKAQGMTAGEARQRAEAAAEALVENAAEFRRAAAPMSMAEAKASETPEQKRARIKAMLSAPKEMAAERKKKDAWKQPLQLVLGARVRFLVGALLLAGCGMWMNQNGLIPGSAEVSEEDAQGLLDAFLKGGKPLEAPVPDFVAVWFSNFNPGVAGLLLIASASIGRLRMAAFAWPGALIMLLGASLGLPALGDFAGAHVTALVVGLAVGVAGFVAAKLGK